MTHEEVEKVAGSNEFADRDRVWAATVLITGGDKNAPITEGAVADFLGWPLSRVLMAVAAAIETGILGNPKTRAEGRKPLIGPDGYTVQRVS